MDEYIKRKVALAKMNYLFRTYVFSRMLTKKMRESLRAIPAADVVEVVRCLECKFAEYIPGPMEYLCRRNGVCFRGRDFCSYGERKMDGGENDA